MAFPLEIFLSKPLIRLSLSRMCHRVVHGPRGATLQGVHLPLVNLHLSQTPTLHCHRTPISKWSLDRDKASDRVGSSRLAPSPHRLPTVIRVSNNSPSNHQSQVYEMPSYPVPINRPSHTRARGYLLTSTHL